MSERKKPVGYKQPPTASRFRKGRSGKTDVFGRAAADYISRNRTKPFFLSVAFNASHNPLKAP